MSSQNKEHASPGDVKVLDKNKNECFVSPGDLLIRNKTIDEKFQELQALYNNIIDSNKKIQNDNNALKVENQKNELLIKELIKRIDDATSFIEES